MKIKGKKGLSSGLIALMLLMFIVAISGLLSITLWNNFNEGIQDADNSTIAPNVKEKINSLGFMVLWSDKLFVILFIVLLISYLISSVTIPVDKPAYLVIFLVILIITTILAMFLSNTWAYLVEQPNFISASNNLSFTGYFMRYFPMITFLTGIAGALLFYGRKRNDNNFNIGGSADAFE